jgi:hypothetical protein
MRKIAYTIVFDEGSYTPIMNVKLREQDGTIIELANKAVELDPINPKGRYSAEQREQIRLVNQMLEDNSQATMTEQECDWMLNPYCEKEPTEDELKLLAGVGNPYHALYIAAMEENTELRRQLASA